MNALNPPPKRTRPSKADRNVEEDLKLPLVRHWEVWVIALIVGALVANGVHLLIGTG